VARWQKSAWVVERVVGHITGIKLWAAKSLKAGQYISIIVDKQFANGGAVVQGNRLNIIA